MQGLDKQWNFLNNGIDMRGIELAGAMQRVPFILGVTTNAGGTQATIEETAISAFRAYSVTFKDINGVEATGVIAAISTPVNVDTSALDPNNPWTMQVILQVKDTGNPDLAESNGSFGYTINTVKSASLSFNNAAGQGMPSIQIAGATVADAGSYNAGSAAVNDVVIVDIDILNTATAANGGLIIESVTATGDGELYSKGGTPTSLNPEAQTSAWSVKFNTGTVGAKAITFVVTSSRSSNVSYSITINLTVA